MTLNRFEIKHRLDKIINKVNTQHQYEQYIGLKAHLSFSCVGTVPVFVEPGTAGIGVPTVRRFWITEDRNCWLALSYKSKQIWYAIKRLSSFTSFSRISLTAWGSSRNIRHCSQNEHEHEHKWTYRSYYNTQHRAVTSLSQECVSPGTRWWNQASPGSCRALQALGGPRYGTFYSASETCRSSGCRPTDHSHHSKGKKKKIKSRHSL